MPDTVAHDTIVSGVATPDIVFEAVSFSYATADHTSADYASADNTDEPTFEDALDSLSFSVERGEFVAIIGANGSGKTTLARHINALLKPRSGRVLTVGLDTSDPTNLFQIRSHAGMVFQDPNTQMVTSIVADDVAFGPENLNVLPPELHQRVDLALAAVSMSEHAESDPSRLSGGERQRVSIAGILAMQPDILILDEPGAMLDVRGRKAVRRIIEELNADGMTVVLITHSMEEAAQADRVIVIDRGLVILDDKPTTVFSEYQILQSLGLDIPFTAQLSEALAQRGLKIPRFMANEELKEYLCAWYSSA